MSWIRTIYNLSSHPSCLWRPCGEREHLARIRTMTQLIDFVCDIGRDRNAEYLSEYILDIWRQKLPTEAELMRLSTLQQQVAGTNGLPEYATLTVWLCALQSIMEAEAARCMLNCRSNGALVANRGAPASETLTILLRTTKREGLTWP